MIDAITTLAARRPHPIVEIAAGDGALTRPLSRLGRPLTAVEVDPRRARRLARRTPGHVSVVHADLLRFRLPPHPHVLVGNVPFHLTTAVLKRLLAAPHWHTAILLVQWEVARRRAGIGGATLLTARWWPWFGFTAHRRVPARSFRPVPSVDAGLLVARRRPRPLVEQRGPYQRSVTEVFTGRGRGLRDILTRTTGADRATTAAWLRRAGIAPHALPRDLTADQWAQVWRAASAVRPRHRGHGRSPG